MPPLATCTFLQRESTTQVRNDVADAAVYLSIGANGFFSYIFPFLELLSDSRKIISCFSVIK
jgi:hypothetical protein